jgi:hypothetical protein
MPDGAAAEVTIVNFCVNHIERSAGTEEHTVKTRLLWVMGLSAWFAASTALAEKKYDPGATDTEIKIGQTYPYSVTICESTEGPVTS